VVDVVEPVLDEQPLDQLVVEDRPLHEVRALRHVLGESAAQVVDDDHAMARLEQMLGDVRPDEPRSPGNQ
jgi:hypothetical protein